MAEPLTLPEAKSHLRIRHSSEDDYITSLIQAARLDVEADSWRALVRGTRTLVLNRFPCGAAAMYLPRPPLVSVESIVYLDEAGEEQTLTGFRVDATHEPGVIVPAHGESWPQTWEDPAAVTITYTAGYADGSVPANAVHCVRLKLSELYENRSPTVAERRSTLDRMLEKLRFRDVRIGVFTTGDLDRVRLGV